jgi:hypothetical protein
MTKGTAMQTPAAVATLVVSLALAGSASGETADFTHTVSGFDFQGKVDGRGPVVFQDVGRKVLVFDPETEEETIVFRACHTTLPEGPEAEAVFCAALA